MLIVDDLEAPAPSQFQWLMHAWEKLDLDESRQSFVSRRGDASMEVRLVTSGGFSFDQTDAWPLDPKTGFPTATQSEPPKRWHFTAATREPATGRRMAAILCVGDQSGRPACAVRELPDGRIEVISAAGGNSAQVTVDLSAEHAGRRPILAAQCRLDGNETETLSVE